MTLQIRKAQRRQAKLRLGLTGPAGAGKTFSALKIAFGLGGKICLVDTECGSGDLYADLGEYGICPIDPPYTIEKYLEAITLAEKEGYDIIILDSISHAWSGDGGLLDQKDKFADRGGNSYTAWRFVTPMHNKFIDAMLQSKSHIIATMRSKTEYVLTQNEKGKMVPKKVGMAPVQREGMDYEFTLVLDIDQSGHVAVPSKDRTSLFDGRFFVPDESTGQELMGWLNSGDGEVEYHRRTAVTQPEPPAQDTKSITGVICEVCGKDAELHYQQTIMEHTGKHMCRACFEKWDQAKKAAKPAPTPAAPKAEPKPEPTPEPVTVVLCSKCGNEAEPEYVDFSKQKAGKVMCKACFEAWAQAQTAAPKKQPKPAPKNTCRSCGKEIPIGTTHCLDCVRADHGEPPKKEQPTPEPVQDSEPDDDSPRCEYCHGPLSERDLLLYQKHIYNRQICKDCAEKIQRGEL